MSGGYHIFAPSSGFPQTTANRTISDILDDLCDYVGGGDRPAARERARRSLAATVRMFNMVPWRFNRQRQTITLLDNTSTYTLNSSFRTPLAAVMLDTADKAIGSPLEWVPYVDWVRYEGDEGGTSTGPEAYTCRNAFLNGEIAFIPRLGTINTQYPKVRLDYHSRIDVPATDSVVLTVPQEVEEAIVQEAVAVIISKTRSVQEGNQHRMLVAKPLYQVCLNEWRDFPDRASYNQA